MLKVEVNYFRNLRGALYSSHYNTQILGGIITVMSYIIYHFSFYACHPF